MEKRLVGAFLDTDTSLDTYHTFLTKWKTETQQDELTDKPTDRQNYTLCSKLLCKSRFSRYFEKYFSKTNKIF